MKHHTTPSDKKRADFLDYPQAATERFAIVPLAIISDRRLTMRQRVVLEALLSFRKKKTGRVFAGLDDIGARCGLDGCTVSRTTNELKRDGYIKIKRNRRGVNDYFFCFALHDWQPGGEQKSQDLLESGKSRNQDLPESVISRNLDLPESDIKTCRNPTTRLAGIRQTPTDQYRPNNRPKRAGARGVDKSTKEKCAMIQRARNGDETAAAIRQAGLGNAPPGFDTYQAKQWAIKKLGRTEQ